MKLKKFEQFNEDMDMSMDMDHMDIEHDIDRDTTTNYMFFENLKTLQRIVEELLSLDETEIDEIIESGHDWVTDHVAVAKADVEQVYDFLMNNADDAEHDIDMEHDMDYDMSMEHDMDIDYNMDDMNMEHEPEDFESNPDYESDEEL